MLFRPRTKVGSNAISLGSTLWGKRVKTAADGFWGHFGGVGCTGGRWHHPVAAAALFSTVSALVLSSQKCLPH